MRNCAFGFKDSWRLIDRLNLYFWWPFNRWNRHLFLIVQSVDRRRLRIEDHTLVSTQWNDVDRLFWIRVAFFFSRLIRLIDRAELLKWSMTKKVRFVENYDLRQIASRLNRQILNHQCWRLKRVHRFDARFNSRRNWLTDHSRVGFFLHRLFLQFRFSPHDCRR